MHTVLEYNDILAAALVSRHYTYVFPLEDKSSLLSHNTAKPGDACPQEQAASAASPSPKTDSTSGKAAQSTHKQEQLQRDLAAAVQAEAEKTRDIQSLGMLGLGRPMAATCLQLVFVTIAPNRALSMTACHTAHSHAVQLCCMLLNAYMNV